MFRDGLHRYAEKPIDKNKLCKKMCGFTWRQTRNKNGDLFINGKIENLPERAKNTVFLLY